MTEVINVRKHQRDERLRDDEERNQLVVQYIPLVYAEARAAVFHHDHLNMTDRDDLVGAGWFGLLRAAELWDPARRAARTGLPVLFITYATRAVRQHILREVNAKRTLLQGCVNYLSGRSDPSQLRAVDYNKLMAACIRPKPVFGHAEWLASREEEDVGKNLHAEEAHARLHELLTLLPDEQRYILELRYLHGKRLREVGECYGVSKERARQLLVIALHGLRRLYGLTSMPACNQCGNEMKPSSYKICGGCRHAVDRRREARQRRREQA